MAVVDISTQGVQRSTTLFVHLATSDLGSVQTTTNLNLDTLSTHAHRRSDGHLNGTTVCNLTLQLLSNLLSYDSGIQLRTLNLEDVDLNILFGDFLQLLFQFVNLLSTLTDNITGASSADSYSHKFQSSLNDDTANASLSKTGVEVLTNLGILKDGVSVVLTSEPVAIPAADNTEAVTNWINFLSHSLTQL